MADTGISTLGITLGYGTGTDTPTTFKKLTRINQIGGITISPNTIDSSALEDLVDKTIAGRASTGGTWAVTVNATDDTVKEWEDVMTAYKGLTGGKQLWFEVIVPGFTKAFFVIAQMPEALPMPQLGQNSLLTMEISLTIVDYKGLATKVALT